MADQNDTKIKHVLLVDDDIELALTYQALLQVNGYEASTAENGAQALKLITRSAVDAILCDLNMPELAGDFFYIEVGRAWPHLLKRFIFITGNAGDPLYKAFLEKVKAPVLFKPVAIGLLLQALETVLRVHPKPSIC